MCAEHLISDDNDGGPGHGSRLPQWSVATQYPRRASNKHEVCTRCEQKADVTGLSGVRDAKGVPPKRTCAIMEMEMGNKRDSECRTDASPLQHCHDNTAPQIKHKGLDTPKQSPKINYLRARYNKQ